MNEQGGQQKIFGEKVYAYLRNYKNEHILVVANFNRDQIFNEKIKLTKDILAQLKGSLKNLKIKNILTGAVFNAGDLNEGLSISVGPSDAIILSF